MGAGLILIIGIFLLWFIASGKAAAVWAILSPPSK